MTKSYSAKFYRDETGVWIAELAEPRGVHTWGRTLEQARRELREALAAWLDDDKAAASAEFREQVDLPGEVSEIVATAREQRENAERVQADAQRALRHAAAVLVNDQHLSIRDAADVLGISHQRVHTILLEDVPQARETTPRYRVKRSVKKPSASRRDRRVRKVR